MQGHSRALWNKAAAATVLGPGEEHGLQGSVVVQGHFWESGGPGLNPHSSFMSWEALGAYPP